MLLRQTQSWDKSSDWYFMRPMIGGFLGTSVVLMVFVGPVIGVLVAALLIRKIDRDQAYPPGTCRSCGYDLTGNVSGRCPECGQEIPKP